MAHEGGLEPENVLFGVFDGPTLSAQRLVSVPPTLRAGSIKMKQSRRSQCASSDCILTQQASCLPVLSPPYTGLEERMAKKGKKNKPTPENMPIIPPHAAGIDVGAEEHWVCVPADRDAQPIQKFSEIG